MTRSTNFVILFCALFLFDFGRGDMFSFFGDPVKYPVAVFTCDNVNDVDAYGYPYIPGYYGTYVGHDEELLTCLKNTMTMFDNEIHIEHDDRKINNPIIIYDKPNNNVFKLYQFGHDFHNVPEQEKNTRYRLVVNDKHTYKFAHISNVQLYFEMINNKFAK